MSFSEIRVKPISGNVSEAEVRVIFDESVATPEQVEEIKQKALELGSKAVVASGGRSHTVEANTYNPDQQTAPIHSDPVGLGIEARR